MAALFTFIAIVAPVLWGRALMKLIYNNRPGDKCTYPEYILTGWLMILVSAFACHVYCIFRGKLLADFERYFIYLGIAVTAAATGICIYYWVKGGKKKIAPEENLRLRLKTAKEKDKTHQLKFEKNFFKVDLVLVCTVLLMVFQIAKVLKTENIYISSDQTLETVQTFLSTGEIYSVNPMTGLSYSAGLPLRVKILCLPTFYAAVCDVMNISPELLLYKLMPVLTLLSYYFSYYILSRVLYEKTEKTFDKRSAKIFFVFVLILLFVTDCRAGFEGFEILHCGYRAVALRAALIIPYCISQALRKRWPLCILAIATELAVCWTLYGMGVCFALTVVLVIVSLVKIKVKTGREAA